MRAALIVLAVLCAGTAAGCGSTHTTTTTTTTTPRAAAAAPASAGLRVGLVGGVGTQASGTSPDHGTLEQVADDPLVLVSAESADAATVASVAAEHPASHFVLVGASTRGFHRSNLLGLVLDNAQAARLGGVVAGLVAGDQGGLDARVAWVGPQESALATAFALGVHSVQPRTTVLRAWSRDLPAACKEAALGAIDRGAVVVMSHGGTCADAVGAGAHQQNLVALRLSDFELPSVPIGIVVGDAVAGVFRGGEDLVFGATSGAVGVNHLDARVSPDIAVRARAAAQDVASGLRPSG